MDTTKCISDLDWKAYAAGNLAAHEVAALHAHAAGCEICGDILAGITALDDAQTLGAQVESLYNQIDASLAKKIREENASLEAHDLLLNPVAQEKKQARRFALYYSWLAAAAVLLIAGFGLLQFQKGFEGGDVAIMGSGKNVDQQKLDQSANSDAQISDPQNLPRGAQDAQAIDEPLLNDLASNHKSEAAAVNKQNELALQLEGSSKAKEMQVLKPHKLLKDGVREEVALSTTQVESVQAPMFSSKAREEDLEKVDETVKALPSQADAVKESKAEESKIASTSRLEIEAIGNDDQAEPQVQIATVTKSQNKLIQKRSKQIKSLPSNAAFTIPSEQELLQNNNSNSPPTNSSHNQTPTDSIRNQSHTDSLLYQAALRQYNSQHLDSAQITLKTLLNNPQGPYYKEGIKLQMQMIDKKKSGK